jgi:hypothetical protein
VLLVRSRSETPVDPGFPQSLAERRPTARTPRPRSLLGPHKSRRRGAGRGSRARLGREPSPRLTAQLVRWRWGMPRFRARRVPTYRCCFCDSTGNPSPLGTE